MLFDVAVIGVFVLLFFGIKPVKSWNDEYLSVSTCNMWRGFLACIIVMHHILLREPTGVMHSWMPEAGAAAVSGFFFFSGYGLQKQYITKGEKYRKHFLAKRLPKVIIPFLIMIFVYWLVYFIEGNHIGIAEIVTGILQCKPIVRYSWFLYDIVFFYLVFCLMMKICGKKHLLMIILTSVYFVVRTAAMYVLHFENGFFKSSHLFIVGMIWAVYEKQITAMIKKFYYIFAPLSLVLFATAYYWISKNSVDGSNAGIKFVLIYTAATMLTNVLFVVCILLVSMKFKVGNKVLKFVGNHSMEVYLVHGLLLYGLRNEYFSIPDKNVWLICVLVGTVIAAFILEKLFTFVLSEYQKLLNRIIKE